MFLECLFHRLPMPVQLHRVKIICESSPQLLSFPGESKLQNTTNAQPVIYVYPQ